MNPPWEQVELKEKEFFATRAPEIAAAPKAADRKRLIAGLAENRPQLYAEYLHTRGLDDNTRLFVGGSGHLDLAAVGGNNFYPLFAELGRTPINGDGGVGAERCRAATCELPEPFEAPGPEMTEDLRRGAGPRPTGRGLRGNADVTQPDPVRRTRG